MKLVELQANNKDEYNRFVASQDSGSFLQSWEWGEWQAALGRPTYRFFVTDNDNTIAAFQLIKMPIFGKKYYLYAPYGPVGNLKSQIPNFKSLLQEKFPEAMFVRLEPKAEIDGLSSIAKKTLHIQPVNTLVLDLSKPVDGLLKEMHPKTRYNIKVAQRHNVCIASDLAITPGYGLYFGEALDLIMQTAKRQDFKTFAADYYQKLLDFFGTKNHQNELKVYVYKALYEKELLAAAVMVDFGYTRTYLFGGSAEKHKNLMAPHLLHFQAISDAKELGLRQYDFWGLDTLKEKNPGFARFKLGFGGQRLLYPGAYDIVLNKLGYTVYQALRYLNRLRF